MPNLAERFPENPILTPSDVQPSRPGLQVACVLNPGAFRFEGRTGLLLRVAERPPQEEKIVRAVVRDPDASGGIKVLEFRNDDPDFEMTDPRGCHHQGQMYLTTLSHLRLAWSDDGVHFTVDEKPALEGEGEMETWGIEDARVSQIGDTYYLTYSSVSFRGVGIGMTRTRDWKTFERVGIVVPPDNKDGAVFEELVGGEYWCLHRPMCKMWGGLNIWIARSPDGVHWGDHRCIVTKRPGMWDDGRVGAGAAPIKTDEGWLQIYHGANEAGRYCLAALLLDLNDPTRVLARSEDPIMEPTEQYEKEGFYGDCIFTNGHVVDSDTVTIYYGASDTVVCGARMAISSILDSLRGT